MNKNILIVLVGAVLVSVLVAVLVQMTLGGSEPVVEVQEEARVEVLVAAKDLKLGHVLEKGDLKWAKWPEGSVFGGAVRRKGEQDPLDAVSGRLGRAISSDEPVMKSALLATDKGNLVAANLDAGQRAVAIEVGASSMVGGFIGPGDYVDVILTYRESVNADNDNPAVAKMLELNLDKLATETILQNVKILAVDQSAKREEEDRVKVGKTVTIAVDSMDAERLILAQRMGNLTLSLRGVGDEQVVEKKWPTISDARLTSMGDEIYNEYERIQQETGINSNIVRIYNGQNVIAVPAQ